MERAARSCPRRTATCESMRCRARTVRGPGTGREQRTPRPARGAARGGSWCAAGRPALLGRLVGDELHRDGGVVQADRGTALLGQPADVATAAAPDVERPRCRAPRARAGGARRRAAAGRAAAGGPARSGGPTRPGAAGSRGTTRRSAAGRRGPSRSGRPGRAPASRGRRSRPAAARGRPAPGSSRPSRVTVPSGKIHSRS